MRQELIGRISEKLGAAGGEYRLTLPRVTDISAQEGIRLEVELLEEGIAQIEVILYPLRIARPEFFPSVRGSVAVMGKGAHRVEIPFGQFEFRQMARAFLSYIDGVAVRLSEGVPFLLKGMEADGMGDFAVDVPKACGVGEAGEWVEYPMRLANHSGKRMLVNIRRSLYGKECLPEEHVPHVVLDAHESREYRIKIRVTEDIPPGGLEKSTFLFVPEGNGAGARKILLQTRKRKKHPYLFLKESQWQRRKAALGLKEELYQAFCREYVEAAQGWAVPEPSGREDYVYPGYAQNGLFKTVVAWKVTGKEAYLQKALKFFYGLLDEERGYLATRKSYFDFIESEAEYARGDFKVCRAQSAGWVQEAEFFNKVAMSYDLLYEFFTPQQHRQMEECLRNYMKFASWRLTDGDGNNFQVAESGAGLLCALALQDGEMAERFLYGYNGITDLLSAVFLDDGMYFEEASGYVRLAGELFFEIANAAENYGISLKDVKVPASFDRNILHSPWAMRETWAEDGKPFLGMSFKRFEEFSTATRSLRDYFDCTAKLLTDRGIMLSVNDSNEQDFTKLYQKAYYLYQDPLYKKIGDLAPDPETLLVPDQAEGEWGRASLLMQGAGLGILREHGAQAVLKFGGHGGYHGHYDRLSLASFIKDNQTFHNNEYAWFGYDSFLFKMWVQTSMAHNMTVVDGRMQKPSPCQCVYYESGEGFAAVCAQTSTEWIDPPYGGQTPYPLAFPQEKCAAEGRYILTPEKPRRQGEIGEYSEAVFQKRLLILFHGYCLVWDYLEGRQEHRYDCLYHPMGRFDKDGLERETGITFALRDRFSEDPFGAGQFIQNCYTARMEGSVCLRFTDAQARVNGNDLIDYVPQATVWRAWPRTGDVAIGKYPQKGDDFTRGKREAAAGYLEEPLKKTVAFTVWGTGAEFITILEAGEDAGQIRAVTCEDFRSVTVTEKDGRRWQVRVAQMAGSEGQVSVEIAEETEL